MTQSGNIVVTDKDLKIIAISRVVSEGEGGEAQQIGLQYSLENRQNFHGIPPITTDRVKDALSKYSAPAGGAGAAAPAKAKKSDLRKLLATSITEVPPILIEHSLDGHGIDIQTKPDEIAESPEQLDLLVKALSDAASMAETISTSSQCKGYIFARRRESKTDAEETDPEKCLLYDDFQPFVPKKLKDDPSITVLEFDNYNKTVDQFFSSLEGQKLESRLIERENAATNRLNTAKRDQAKRIEDLQEAQTLNMRKAAAIEANVERVQEAMDAVSSLVEQGMDWVDIGRLIEREKTRQNPVAQMIHLPLKLEENTITVLLNEADEEEEEEDEVDSFSTDDESDLEDETQSPPKNDKPTKALKVDIVLSISPWSNAREYYDQRRTAASKEEKTHIQNEKALKSAEQKIQTDLKKVLKQEKALLQPIRQPMWFEKFFWFVSSDGYLVLGGKDPAQHELLYKRHLGKGDVFCHADTKDACAVIIKNNPLAPDSPIPPTTLSQAGNFCICSSAAWDSKAGMGAWWANASQVSKLNAAGEVLPNGEFYVQGEKNHLPPGQLIMGLGLMFKISDSSTANHVKNRPGIYTGFVPKTEPVDEVPTDQAGAEADAQSETESVADLTDDEDAKKDEQAVPDKQEDATTESLKKLQIEEKTEPEAEPEAGSLEDEAQDEDDVADSQDSPAPGTPKGAPKRGQRRKAKKVAAKYRDQDDEDRKAAEVLLGSALGAQRAEARAKEREDRTAWLEAERQRKQAVKSRQDKQTKEFEKQRQANSAAEAGGYVEQPLALLDGLVGTPSAGDEIVDVVVVCAPISATTKMKYKIKMQPGPQKKGKLVREVLERWKIDAARKGVVDEQAMDTGRMWPREVELMKGLKAEEVVNVVPVAKARVMLSGGAGGGGKGGGGGGVGKGKSKK